MISEKEQVMSEPKTIKSTSDLYGIEPRELKDMLYVDALKHKCKGAKAMMALYRHMASQMNDKTSQGYRYYLNRYKQSEEALLFTRELLAEMGEKDE